jgi:hypothetical protein
MVYGVAELINLIGEGGYPIPSSSSWRWPFGGTPQLQQLNKTDLVMVDGHHIDGSSCSLHPQTNIPVARVMEFILANQEAIASMHKSKDDPEVLLRNKMMGRAKEEDCILWTVDHHFEETDICYYVTVNR